MMLNGEKFEAFLPRSGTRQGCPFSPLLFNIISEALPNAVRLKKKKRSKDWEGRNKTVFVHRLYDHLCRKSERTDLKKNKLLGLISDYSKIAGYKANIQMSIAFLYTNNEQVEFEVKNTITIYFSIQKTEILTYKSNKICIRSI